MSTTPAAPSLMPEALPAVTVPFLSNAGRSFFSVSAVVPCFGYSSSRHDDVALAALDRHGNDLVLEAARLLRLLGLALRVEGEFVLLLAADLLCSATFSAVCPI